MSDQIEERQDLTETIYMSGYGLLREDCINIAEQIQEQGYHKYDDLIAKMTEEVDGWKRHFESLYETNKAVIRTEIAREIFAELKTVMIDEYRYPIIAELKKKYGVEKDGQAD